LFEEAMIKESGERNMEAAIDLYKQVIDRAGSDRLLASKARLRMGNCYERLGKIPEATELYIRIVTDTADSAGEIARMAKTNVLRLQSMEPINKGAKNAAETP